MATVCLHFYLITICSFLGIFGIQCFGHLVPQFITAPIVVRTALFRLYCSKLTCMFMFVNELVCQTGFTLYSPVSMPCLILYL